MCFTLGPTAFCLKMMSVWNIWHHIFKFVRGLQYPVKHH
jgi:hypothetical protein